MNQSAKVPPSKTELLAWINGVLKQQDQISGTIHKIEDLGNGAAYCSVFNILHPGSIPMLKVHPKPKFQHENTSNLKLLATAFMKLNIPRSLEVEKVAKMKYQDNLDMIQWLYKYASTRKLNSAGNTEKNKESQSNQNSFSFSHQHISLSQFNSAKPAGNEGPNALPMVKKRQVIASEPTPEQIRVNCAKYSEKRTLPDQILFEKETRFNQPQTVDQIYPWSSPTRRLNEIKDICQRQEDQSSKKFNLIKNILFGKKVDEKNLRNPSMQNNAASTMKRDTDLLNNSGNDGIKENNLLQSNSLPSINPHAKPEELYPKSAEDSRSCIQPAIQTTIQGTNQRTDNGSAQPLSIQNNPPSHHRQFEMDMFFDNPFGKKNQPNPFLDGNTNLPIPNRNHFNSLEHPVLTESRRNPQGKDLSTIFNSDKNTHQADQSFLLSSHKKNEFQRMKELVPTNLGEAGPQTNQSSLKMDLETDANIKEAKKE